MVMKEVHQALEERLGHHSLRCPRCDSGNTKFCYYNNYSLLQPRHFCRACKRYWTRGGTLRSVPVGGGSRKNGKRNKKPKVGVGGGVGGGVRKNEVNRLLYGLEVKNQADSSDLSTSCNGYGNGLLACPSSSSPWEIHDIMNLSTNVVGFPGYESSFVDSSLEQPPLMLDDLTESVTTSHEQAMFADLMPVARELKIEQGNDLMGSKFDFGAPSFEPMSSSLDSTVNWSMIWPDLANYGSSIASLM